MDGDGKKDKKLKLPGGNCLAIVTLPLRIVIFLILFVLLYILMLLGAFLRAIFMRCWHGKPSKILKKGSFNNVHKPGIHYPGMQLFDHPLDEQKLRPALVGLCAEDGLKEEEIDLTFVDEEPNPEWPDPAHPAAGSPRFMNHYVRSLPKGQNFWDYNAKLKGKFKVRFHVFNGQPGNPTVVHYLGSGNSWDGSSNFNFTKELMRRYVGQEPKDVFPKPEMSAECAAKIDQKSFCAFLCKMPFNLARSLGGLLWNVVRGFPCFGGNGVGPKICMMNFSADESVKLYNGAKALGTSPFACMTYACVKACDEVVHQKPWTIVQQASLQTRHFPIKDQGESRDFVGEWLVGPLQYVPSGEYTIEDAHASYENLQDELREIGPRTQDSFMAKAYGIINCGAALFEMLPTYNDGMGVFDRCLFMNNYGVRTIPEESHFLAWNWNAPFWFGFNTINVNGRTSTLMGSFVWGEEVVSAFRDSVEKTLREIMDKVPEDAVLLSVPSFKRERSSAIVTE